MIKQEMEALQQSTLETVERVASVLEKCKLYNVAEKSSSLIKTICSDIKNLDDARKNITLTISSLKKLMMLSK
jgi:Vps53-like, N-terminal